MKSAISLIIFFAIAVIAWWTITKSGDDQLEAFKSEQYIEVFMNEFEITAMNENGIPDYILNGTHLERYNNSSNTHIQQPVFQLLQKNNQWKIIADKARINDKSEIIVLRDNVVMQQQNIEPAVTIRTQSLVFNTKKQVVTTNEAVEITQGNSLMKSKGMIFNNFTSELELSSNVSGYYLPYD